LLPQAAALCDGIELLPTTGETGDDITRIAL